MSSLLVLVFVISIGLLFGRISLWGISFGTSSILFIALAAGHFGFEVPVGIGDAGLALFVYCVGISAGPTFFRGLAAHGRSMACLGGLIVIAGVTVTWISARIFDIPADLAGGLMAGALTSTPALGAITQTAANPENVAVGFGVAYPIGIVTVVFFVQIAYRLNAILGTKGTTDGDTADESRPEVIERRAVEVRNPGVIGKRPSEVAGLADSRCQLSRVELEKSWRPTPADYVFAIGSHVMLVGETLELDRVAETLGVVIDHNTAVLDADRERKRVVVTSRNILGRTLKELRLRSRHGVTVARIRRHEIEFVPSSQTRIEFGDTLTIVGETSNLAMIESTFGHRPRIVNETDLLSLVIGLGMGVLLGQAAFSLGAVTVSLGLAGGPLVVGLVLGHFRRVGPIHGSFPPAAQLLMTEGGLAVFLTSSGVTAGAKVADVMAEHGIVLCLAAAIIVVVPLFMGYAAARLIFKLNPLASLGSTCGGMTSTPGLAALTGLTDSGQPVTSYVAAYPVALLIVTIVAPLLVELLG